MLARRRLALAAATLGMASCGSSAAADTSSGVLGKVLIAPTCAVQRSGTVCSRPYATTLIILGATRGRVVAQVRSSRSGRFRVALRPGRYVVRASRSGPPWARPLHVTVHRDRYTRATIVFDSGIR